MRIGVLTDSDTLDSYIADDFGRAKYLLIVDPDTLDYVAVFNEHADAAEGAGMKVAGALIGLGLDAVITGGIGPHGYDALTKAGIKVSFDEEGTAEEGISNFKRRLGR
jgi:predicted Fe-Mo cluster-binding NifX family protein